MNTFFRIAVYICIALMVFTLLVNFVNVLGAFPYTTGGGEQIGDTGDVLSDVTTLDETNMGYLWGLMVGAGALAGLAIGYLTHSVVPIGVFIFGSVFWASFISAHSILAFGGFIPGDFLTIFTIVTVFIFIAAVIGMLTGSG